MQRIMVTEMARRHLAHLHPVGVQIARAQIHHAATNPNGCNPPCRTFLPIELTDLPPHSYSSAWIGLTIGARGRDDQDQWFILDLHMDGDAFRYDRGRYIINGAFPDVVVTTLSDEPSSLIDLPGWQRPMAVSRTGEGIQVRVDQDEHEFDLGVLGSQCSGNRQRDHIHVVPPLGDRLAAIIASLEEGGYPLQDAMASYAAMMTWYETSMNGYALENFPISREWMASRGGVKPGYDVKRLGGSTTSELTPVEQTMLETEECRSGQHPTLGAS